jgi:hypothetical protein
LEHCNENLFKYRKTVHQLVLLFIFATDTQIDISARDAPSFGIYISTISSHSHVIGGRKRGAYCRPPPYKPLALVVYGFVSRHSGQNPSLCYFLTKTLTPFDPFFARGMNPSLCTSTSSFVVLNNSKNPSSSAPLTSTLPNPLNTLAIPR